MFRPDLTKFRSSSPSAKAINQLNRAVASQSNMRPGDGMGVSVGPFGRLMSLNSVVLMYAKANGDGIPAASDQDDGSRTFGRGEAYTASLAREGDDYILKPNSESIEVLNLSLMPVEPDNWLMICKILNVWQVFWEECKPPDDQGPDEGEG